ncbi:MAG TPA: long-chain-fatty-acid--CoA ligase [Pseudolabrys sp.]|uniref:class I adenylate-forming enzyme family protein n=1 Tax=Pseudolabrys sp. TaxID=1960880 RepID=UPI002DDCD02D|nr:long-chain-fatty-acid--CoA ligase [Pseudolabrys sp.]HEV2628441.1 long-chain-fatty-acid--CoA ligase [Pseudolabrys sp.]
MLKETIDQLLPGTAARLPDKPALIFADRTLTFRELERLTNKAANGFKALGVGKGDRVTLFAQNSPEWVISYAGIAKAGAVINPVNAMLTADELAYVVKDCGAKVLITTPDRARAIIHLKTDGHLKEIVVIGEPISGTLAFTDLLAAQPEVVEAPGNKADDLSTICYTSGTTGFPKGAMLSHRNVMLNAALTAAMNVRTEHDNQFTGLPLAHVYGTVVMNLSFMLGLTFVLLEKFDTQQALEAIQRHKVTIIDGVPTMFLYMLAHPDFDKYDLSSLRAAVVGGQAMPPAKSKDWFERTGTEVLELWGMTELAGPGIMQHSYCENRLGSVGIMMPFMHGRIADPVDPSKTMKTGEVGELVVKGPLNMLGYYGNEQATHDTIDADGWLHSGDLGKMDEDGYIYIVDRKKDMILTAGYNIYPAEIERVIAGHPAVAMVGVGAKADPNKGEIAKAYIVLKAGANVDADDVISYCRKHLAAYKVPREVQFVAALPTTSSGKILRRQLKTLDKDVQTSEAALA